MRFHSTRSLQVWWPLSSWKFTAAVFRYMDKRVRSTKFQGCENHSFVQKEGERADCNNHRGISLLCIAGKILARIIVRRATALAEEMNPESQCGYRENRSYSGHAFCRASSARKMQRTAAWPLYSLCGSNKGLWLGVPYRTLDAPPQSWFLRKGDNHHLTFSWWHASTCCGRRAEICSLWSR